MKIIVIRSVGIYLWRIEPTGHKTDKHGPVSKHDDRGKKMANISVLISYLGPGFPSDRSQRSTTYPSHFRRRPHQTLGYAKNAPTTATCPRHTRFHESKPKIRIFFFLKKKKIIKKKKFSSKKWKLRRRPRKPYVPVCNRPQIDRKIRKNK